MLDKKYVVDIVNGRLWGLRGKLLSFPIQKRNGYKRAKVKLANGTLVHEYLHTIICTYAHGKRPPKHQVCHIDNDKLNCRADNLYWGTEEDQIKDRKLNTASRKKTVRLSKEDKDALRELSGQYTNIELSREFNITPRTVQKIINS